MVEELFSYSNEMMEPMGATSGDGVGLVPLPSVTIAPSPIIRRRVIPIPPKIATSPVPAPVLIAPKWTDIQQQIPPPTIYDSTTTQINAYTQEINNISMQMQNLQKNLTTLTLSNAERAQIQGLLANLQNRYMFLQNEIMRLTQAQSMPPDPCSVPIGGYYPPQPKVLEDIIPLVKNNPQFRACFQKMADDWLNKMAPSAPSGMIDFFKMMPLELLLQIVWWHGQQYRYITGMGGAG